MTGMRQDSGTVWVGGIDLGRSWNTTGSAKLAYSAGYNPQFTACEVNSVPWPQGDATALEMALAIDKWALHSAISAVSIDGPQAWRNNEERPGVGRLCEYVCRTPGKTGRFGTVFPRTWNNWVTFSIEVFDHLRNLNHVVVVDSHVLPRTEQLATGKYLLLESFPTAAWRSSGLVPLPGHANAPPAVVARFACRLFATYRIPFHGNLDHHDHLQAVVAAITAAAANGGPCIPVPCGLPPTHLPVDGNIPAHWVEGIIVNAKPIWLIDDAPAPGEEEPVGGGFVDADNPLLPDDRDENSDRMIDRGRRLMEYLASEANEGRPKGISYSQFVAFVHGVNDFVSVAGRKYLPSDTRFVLSLAAMITEAGGRINVQRNHAGLEAGMDTFIWSKAQPYDRPTRAWEANVPPLPYDRDTWLTVFPEGERSLVSEADLCRLRG